MIRMQVGDNVTHELNDLSWQFGDSRWGKKWPWFKIKSAFVSQCCVLADAVLNVSCQKSKRTRESGLSRKDCFVLKASTAIREIEFRDKLSLTLKFNTKG